MEKQPLAPDDPRHGTPNGYNNCDCRCSACALAWSKYERRREAQERWRVKAGVIRPREERRGYRASTSTENESA